MSPREVARAVKLHEQGYTLREIAEELGYKRNSDGYVLRHIRDQVQPRRTGPRGRVDVSDEQVLELRDELQLSFGQMAQELGMSKSGAKIRYYNAKGWRRDPVTRQWIPPGHRR